MNPEVVLILLVVVVAPWIVRAGLRLKAHREPLNWEDLGDDERDYWEWYVELIVDSPVTAQGAYRLSCGPALEEYEKETDAVEGGGSN